ncbi:exopolyphosphatase PRUNE1 [Anopheles ziemanni]|uniref:exopolyphosphatase PRUNE1 n=1 Tax=Anopheles coustani TaxID=139045 RepID=UPI002659BF69|nr:exopolyphosphatase PRUNE1 [Anopheles coustani]XP_058172948.1 exopolyphosphatase PRUNE1 [Anopheles ziemanni]
MNKYLQRCKELLKSSINKIVVIGNESCDLDSAVSSIAFAFFLEHKPSLLKSWHDKDTLVVPVLNVLRNELPLKTEVAFFLKQQGICLDDLVCKNDVDWDQEQSMKVVLVDHHVTKLKQNIIGIVDHRPLDSNARFNEEAFRTIELVGSCATLVGREIVNSGALHDSNGLYSTALDLLYGAIVLDTVNFSKQADKAKPLDHEIAEYIEARKSITEESRSVHRESLFKGLVAARSDVSQLNAYQLLLKDLKTVGQNNRIVTVPGFPMAVQEYLNLPQREEHLSEFAGATKSNVVVLLGMKVLPDGSVRRDIGVVPINDETLSEKICTALLENEEMDFGLEKIPPTTPCAGTFYQQHNLKASRKQLMPIIINVLSCLD